MAEEPKNKPHTVAPAHVHLDPNSQIGMAQGLMTILGIPDVGPITARDNPQTDKALDTYAKANGMPNANDLGAVLDLLKKAALDLISQPGKLKELNDSAETSKDRNAIKAYQYTLASQGGNFSKYGIDGYVGRDETERAYGDVEGQLQQNAVDNEGPDPADANMAPVDNDAPPPAQESDAAAQPAPPPPAEPEQPPAAAASPPQPEPAMAAAPQGPAGMPPVQLGAHAVISANFNAVSGRYPFMPHAAPIYRVNVVNRIEARPARLHQNFNVMARGGGFRPAPHAMFRQQRGGFAMNVHFGGRR